MKTALHSFALSCALCGATIAHAQTATLVTSSTTYDAGGGSISFTATIDYSELTPTALGWAVTIPAGWSYASTAGADVPNVAPEAGTTGVLEWAYTTIPAANAQFTFVVDYPAGQTGDQTIAAEAYYRTPLQTLTVPDIVLGPVVATAPAITTPPVDQAVGVGEEATFTVAATGVPEPHFRWQRMPDGDWEWYDLGDGGSYSGTASATLTVSAATAAMDGDRFRCVVSNGVGPDATSAAATLTVNVAPTFTWQPASRALAPSESATFVAVAVGSPSLIDYRWQSRPAGDPPAEWSDLSDDAHFSGTGDSALQVADATLAMSGTQLRCIASNGVLPDAISDVATLTVAKRSATIFVSGAIQPYDGTPKSVTVSTIPSGLAFDVTYDGGSSPPIEPGEHAVVITINDVIYDGRLDATLRITCPPAITLQPADQTAAAGEGATFSVTGTGTPAPTYQWMRRRARQTEFVDLTDSGAFTGTNTATLHISRVTAPMSGDVFRCVVSNGLPPDVTSAEVTLTVTGGGVVLPCWPMQGGNARRDGYAAVAGPTAPTLVWTYDFEDRLQDNAGPVVGPDGSVYVPTEDDFYALNADGTLRWKQRYDGFHSWGAMRCAPALSPDASIVYAIASSSAGDCLTATDAVWGDLVWARVLGGFGTWVSYSSLAVDSNGVIYVATALEGLMAINPDGTLKWVYDATDEAIGIEAPPAVGADGGVYFVHNVYGLYALSSTGALDWTGEAYGGYAWPTPLIGPDGAVYVAGEPTGYGYGTEMRAFEADGSLRWVRSDFEGGGWFAGLAMSDDGNTVYTVREDGTVFALATATGATVWASRPGAVSAGGSPVLSGNGLLYFAGERETGNGRIFAVSATDGQLVWDYELNSFWMYWGPQSPALGPDGTLYAVSSGTPVASGGINARLHAFRATAPADLPSPTITSHPLHCVVQVGDPAMFAVTAVGDPAPSYRWQRQEAGAVDWVDLQDDATFSGSHAATLLLGVANGEMDGDSFRCIVDDGQHPSLTSLAAVLDTRVPPLFLDQPSNYAGFIGGSATFIAGSAGDPFPTRQWQRKPAGSEDWEDLENSVTYSGVTEAVFTVHNLVFAMNGDQFRCVATNDAGSAASDPATLTVQKLPAEVSLSNLDCVYDGTPKPVTTTTEPAGLTVVITYDGSATAPTNAGTYDVVATIEDANYQGSTSDSLTIAKAPAEVVLDDTVQLFDGTAKHVTVSTTPVGLAVEIVYYGGSEAPSTIGTHPVIATVVDANYAGTVYGQIVITPILAAASAPVVLAGDDVVLTATVSGGAEATFQWQIRYNSGGPLRAGRPSDVEWADIPGATGSTYEIPSAQRFHNAEYRVVATIGGESVASQPVVVEVAAPAPSDSRLLNLSTRALSLTGNERLIPGFVVTGAGTKKLLIRAVGPTLAGWNVEGTLPDPELVLKHRVSVNPEVWEDVAANDNWGGQAPGAPTPAEIAAAALRIGAFDLAPGSADAALLIDLAPGVYGVLNSGVGGGTGVAMVEVYDADEDASTANLVNISNRGFVGTGFNVMIPGFVVSSEGPKTFLVRAVGPALAAWNLTGLLENPKVQVFHRIPGNPPTEELILENDDWGENGASATAYTAQIAAQVGAFTLTEGGADAAFVITLPPGIYSAMASGADGGTGLAMVEVYVVE